VPFAFRLSTAAAFVAVGFFLSPIGAQGMFHSDGEMAVARAAQAKKSLQILSTVTSHSVEDVIKARGGPVWYQLYAVSDWSLTEKVAKRAEDAGCPVLAWTIDLLAGRNTETASRFRRIDSRGCASCHGEPFGAINHRPMFDGLEMKGVTINSPTFSWTYVDRLKKATRMKLVLKGIETREDARLCVEHGVDGILVSNHGGRATETYRGTIECLPEVVDAVAGRIPVMVDGGIRRGTDAYKALAFGARAVGIGRLRLGPVRVWTSRRRKSGRYSQHRIRSHDEAMRRAIARRDQPLHGDVSRVQFIINALVRCGSLRE